MVEAKKINMYILIAIILQLVWGLVPSASKFVIDEIPVELYIAIRWSISGLIFAGFILIFNTWKKISIGDFLSVSLLGIFGYGLASLGTLYGLKVGGVSNFALMATIGPVLNSLSSILILKEKPTLMYKYSLLLVFLGLIMLVTGKYKITNIHIAGLSFIYIFAGFFLESLVFVYSKKFKSKMNVSQYLAISQVSTALLMWFLQFVYFQQYSNVSHVSNRAQYSIVFVSVVACVLCFSVLYWLLNYIEGHKLSLFDGLHTLSSTVCGYFIFNEQIQISMYIGAVLILFGIIMGNFKKLGKK